MDKFTEFCMTELRVCLRSECQQLNWTDEETIEGRDFRTSFDVCGKNEEHVVLIQFEMHREGAATNVLKAAYCLESSNSFKGKSVLIVHIFSPFFEKVKRDDITIPAWVNQNIQSAEEQKERVNIYRKRFGRESGRRNAYIHKLLCLFLKQKGIFDTATTDYEIIQWNLDNIRQVREATIDFPEQEQVPEETREAIVILAKHVRKVIEEWLKKYEKFSSSAPVLSS